MIKLKIEVRYFLFLFCLSNMASSGKNQKKKCVISSKLNKITFKKKNDWEQIKPVFNYKLYVLINATHSLGLAGRTINYNNGSPCVKVAPCGSRKIFFNTLHPSCFEILHLYTFNSAPIIKKYSGLKKICVGLEKKQQTGEFICTE